MRQFWCLMVVFIVCLTGGAKGQALVRLEWSQDSIVIGDTVHLIISIEKDPGVEVIAIPSFFIDTIYSSLQSFKNAVDTSNIQPVKADFAIRSLNGWKDADGDNIFFNNEMNWQKKNVLSKTVLEHRFSLQLWDPGQNVAIIPPVLISVNGAQDQIYTPGQAVIKVVAPPGVTSSMDSLEMAPIRNIIEEPIGVSDVLPYLIGVGIIFLLLGGYYLYQRRTKSVTHAPIPAPVIETVLPHIKALNDLALLRSKQLWQQGEIKEYQSVLTFIIRRYLEERFNIEALEKTTNEIRHELATSVISTDQMNRLIQVLTVADLVKFAKATPEEELHESFMNEAITFVHHTKIEPTEEKQ